jgi:hypothetical protein
MGVERAHQPFHAQTIAGDRELQLFQVPGVHQPTDE